MKLALPNSKVDNLKSSLFIIGILFLVIVSIWVIFSVSQAFRHNQTDPEINALLSPIDPVLDTSVLASYQQSRQTPPPEFKIKVTVDSKTGNLPQTSFLDPFTNQSQPVSASSSPDIDLSPQPGE